MKHSTSNQTTTSYQKPTFDQQPKFLFYTRGGRKKTGQVRKLTLKRVDGEDLVAKRSLAEYQVPKDNLGIRGARMKEEGWGRRLGSVSGDKTILELISKCYNRFHGKRVERQV
jgi:hypothetical protein